MTTSVPPLPAELQARLDEIMARRPKDGRVCATHWLMLNQPLGCVEVQSCACHGLTIPERRLIRQYERGERVTPAADELAGACDEQARAKLRERAMRSIGRTPTVLQVEAVNDRDENLELTLADPTSLLSLLALYERLSGKKMSKDGIAKLRAELEQPKP